MTNQEKIAMLAKVIAKKYRRKKLSIQEYYSQWYRKINCNPIGQRLEVDDGPEKRVGIIRTILLGINIGEITIVQNEEGALHQYDSVDGGHRKRYIWSYLNNEFEVDGKKFNQLTQEEQDKFNSYELSFVIYEHLDVFTRGFIFRTINETTDVNHMEMLNSYGDIHIANLVRYLVRSVKGIENDTHILFNNWGGNFQYLGFNNKRLTTEQLVARIAFRYMMGTSGKHTYLGSSSDQDIQMMYEIDWDEKQISDLKSKLDKHFDFLFECAKIVKRKASPLSQQHFKMLSFLYLHLIDKYGKFKIDDYDTFISSYLSAMTRIKNYSPYTRTFVSDLKEIDFDDSGRSISEAFVNYLGAPHHEKKIRQTVKWLLQEFDVDMCITPQDKKRSFTKSEREMRLAEQDFKCYIDGKELDYNDAEAAHKNAYAEGGPTSMENMVMVRKKYNRAMGTVSVEDYKSVLDNAV